MAARRAHASHEFGYPWSVFRTQKQVHFPTPKPGPFFGPVVASPSKVAATTRAQAGAFVVPKNGTKTSAVFQSKMYEVLIRFALRRGAKIPDRQGRTASPTGTLARSVWQGGGGRGGGVGKGGGGGLSMSGTAAGKSESQVGGAFACRSSAHTTSCAAPWEAPDHWAGRKCIG